MENFETLMFLFNNKYGQTFLRAMAFFSSFILLTLRLGGQSIENSGSFKMNLTLGKELCKYLSVKAYRWIY